jgi:aryl-alcohol dehydrogenase-like predicted oxidoreductase
LKTDRVDLLQIHMQDVDTPTDEILRSLDDLVRQGKVLYIGCSNYTAYKLVESLWISRTQHLERFVSAQMRYNLTSREIEREHVPVCEQYGVGILPWSPLAGGFLTGKYRKDAEPPSGTRLDHWRDRLSHFDQGRNWQILDALLAVAVQVESTPAAVALAWLLQRPTVASVVFGARSVQQLDDNVAAAALTLPEPAMVALTDASRFDVGYPYNFIARIQGRW